MSQIGLAGQRRFFRPRTKRRRGVAMLYAILVIVALVGICSLAVDLARIQAVKSDLQRVADATARGYVEYYLLYGSSYANTAGPALYASNANPVDNNSGVTPTVTVTWGSWNSSTKTFTAGGSSPVAVRVQASRTAANNNAVPLFWAWVLGRRKFDVTCDAVATYVGGQSSSVTVPATANPYLAGMPTATTNIGGDTYTNAAPKEVTGIPVIPGTYIYLTSVGGSTCVLPGYVSNGGPDGVVGIPVHHGQNYNYTIDMTGPENGIADAIMPESAVCGLFLDDNAPSSSATPGTVVDWTNPSNQNQPTYANLSLKSPFLIGNGKTTGGVTQRFLVPPNATRLFVSIWDGIGYNNNTGSISATTNVEKSVVLVE